MATSKPKRPGRPGDASGGRGTIPPAKGVGSFGSGKAGLSMPTPKGSYSMPSSKPAPPAIPPRSSKKPVGGPGSMPGGNASNKPGGRAGFGKVTATVVGKKPAAGSRPKAGPAKPR